MSGWIKLHRDMVDWEWYNDHNTTRVFIHCLFKANHIEKKWRGIIIKRGEFISSYDALASETTLSRQQVRTSIKKLKSTNNITTKSCAQHTVFIIDNYEKYQEDNQSSNHPITNEQPTSNQRATTTKNDKNDKNKDTPKKINGFKPPSIDITQQYFLTKGSTTDEGSRFFNYYESNGWKVGKNKMKKWESAASGWISRNNKNQPSQEQEFFG